MGAAAIQAAVIFPFSFKGQLTPLPYAAASFAVFFSQHLLTFVAFGAHRAPPALDWRFFFTPFRSLVTQGEPSNLTLILAFAYLLAVSWALAGLAFRRAANANVSEWVAAAAITPFIQAPVIAALCLLPSRSATAAPVVDQLGTADSGSTTAVHGLIAGLALTLLAVAMSTLVFGSYGFGVFVVSPFVIGAATAYFANRKGDLGLGRTARLVSAATVLGGIALVLAALEGILCIALAAPLGIGLALIGGLLGRAIAISRQQRARQLLPGLALLPLAFALESVLPPQTTFARARQSSSQHRRRWYGHRSCRWTQSMSRRRCHSVLAWPIRSVVRFSEKA